jgi:small subunit ribosomal protein S19e
MRREVDSQALIEKLASKLQKDIKAPEWASVVKTGHGRQRPPVRNDWWQVRAASMMLKVQRLGPIGVNKLSVKYGNRKNRGVRPEKFAAGSRSVIRKIMQQLEEKKYVQKAEAGVHKGKILTQTGNRLIIEASKEAMKKVK